MDRRHQELLEMGVRAEQQALPNGPQLRYRRISASEAR